MRTLQIFHVDAFCTGPFSGNPAAVVPLEAWPDDAQLGAIAAQNNLSETAFFRAEGVGYRLRWFSPAAEVTLCGHATLAAAHVLFEELGAQGEMLRFSTSSGELTVTRGGETLSMSLPRWTLVPAAEVPRELESGLGVAPEALYNVSSGDNWFAVLGSEQAVRDVRPDFASLVRLHPAGVAVTAPGDASDCVCRYFAPSYGVPEDPGTGSIHCGLAPYWAARLGKTRIHSRQVSARGAELICETTADRTLVAGRARTYLEGSIRVP
jgi:PhzF family phenazine biosynthesis protein